MALVNNLIEAFKTFWKSLALSKLSKMTKWWYERLEQWGQGWPLVTQFGWHSGGVSLSFFTFQFLFFTFTAHFFLSLSFFFSFTFQFDFSTFPFSHSHFHFHLITWSQSGIQRHSLFLHNGNYSKTILLYPVPFTIHLLLLAKKCFFFLLTIPICQICHMPMSYWRNAQFWSTQDGPHDIYAGHTVWYGECFWMNDSFAGVRYDLGQSLWFMGRMLSISEAWLATPD